MRIQSLLEREPFGEILEHTLPGLLNELTGRRHVVRWYDCVGDVGASAALQTWLCNPSLNAIFVPTVRREALAPIVREYGRSPIWWRRALQSAYVAAGTRRPSAAWLAGPRVVIDPPLEDPDFTLLMGGNHRLRMIDARRGVSHVIAKVGCDERLMRAEIALRRSRDYLAIPRLLAVGATETWFTEALVPGTPLNRLADAQVQGTAFAAACAQLERMTLDSLREVPRDEYIDGLVVAVREGLRAVPLLDSIRDRVEPSTERLACLAGKGRVALAQSHGDLQPGNILSDGDSVWLIDWEYTGLRQSGYDPLVYGLQARFPTGLAGRVRAALRDREAAGATVLRGWPGLDWSTRGARHETLAMFFLEELALRIRESGDPHLRRLDVGTLALFAEVAGVVDVLTSIN